MEEWEALAPPAMAGLFYCPWFIPADAGNRLLRMLLDAGVVGSTPQRGERFVGYAKSPENTTPASNNIRSNAEPSVSGSVTSSLI